MSTVRIKETTTRAHLREIEEATGTGPSEALARAVDSFRRSLMFANTDIHTGRHARTQPTDSSSRMSCATGWRSRRRPGRGRRRLIGLPRGVTR